MHHRGERLVLESGEHCLLLGFRAPVRERQHQDPVLYYLLGALDHLKQPIDVLCHLALIKCEDAVGMLVRRLGVLDDLGEARHGAWY